MYKLQTVNCIKMLSLHFAYNMDYAWRESINNNY